MCFIFSLGVEEDSFEGSGETVTSIHFKFITALLGELVRYFLGFLRDRTFPAKARLGWIINRMSMRSVILCVRESSTRSTMASIFLKQRRNIL